LEKLENTIVTNVNNVEKMDVNANTEKESKIVLKVIVMEVIGVSTDE
jgi:hypothetical protein